MTTASKIKRKVVSLPDIVGKGYGTFWRSKHRYRVVKGSRGSKKSKTMGLNLITKLMEYPEANALVVRKTYRTIKDSCFTELKWAIRRLGVEQWWDIKESPLELTYKPTGQKIYFRGLDDPLKVTSITVEVGVLCWLWIEEAYEINSEADFDTLDESIRGEMPEGLYKQATLTMNPWNEHHWIKARFFDRHDDNVLAMTTDYRCNEWLDESDIQLFERMKERNPRRYQVAGLGEWGVTDGLVYENWSERKFTLDDIREDGKVKLITACGLDYGYTNDPSAFIVTMLDLANRRIYIFDEFYEKGMSNKAIAEKIGAMGYAKENITADSSEPKSNAELRSLGLRVSGAKKGKDSVLNGVQWIQDFEIIIHPRCENFIYEISNYTWDEDKFGNKINRPVDEFNHLMDALRYGIEKYIDGDRFSFD